MAQDFLGQLDGGVMLCTMAPDGGGPSALRGPNALTQALARNARGYNAYYVVNAVRSGVNKKPAKGEIETIRAVAGDIDWDRKKFNGRFREGTQELANTVLTALIKETSPQPSWIIFTGGGLQPIWLIEPLPNTPENVERAEALGACIADRFGGDGVQNIDRILRLPVPPTRNTTLADILEDNPVPAPAKAGVRWRTPAETGRLLAMMTPGHIEQVEAAKRAGKRMVGGLYRRTRPTKDGAKVSRWEVRFDGVAGCLRVPAGGSSRQTIMVVEGASVRSRLLSPREAARLMGLADSYTLPANTNEVLALMGDGVVVPVVRHLAQHILEPVLAAQGDQMQAAGVTDAADGEINIWDGVDIEDEIDTGNEVELDEVVP